MSLFSKKEKDAIVQQALKDAEKKKLEEIEKEKKIEEKKKQAEYTRKMANYNSRCFRYRINSDGIVRLVHIIADYTLHLRDGTNYDLNLAIREARLEKLAKFINELVPDKELPPKREK